MEVLSVEILMLLLNIQLIICQNDCCTDVTQQCQTVACVEQINCCKQCESVCTTCCCTNPCTTSDPTNRNCPTSSCRECRSKCGTSDCNETPCVIPTPQPVLLSNPTPLPNSAMNISNTDSMVAAINITSSVIVENHINLPITFNNENKNDIHIVFDEATDEQSGPVEPSVTSSPLEVETTPATTAVPIEATPSSDVTTCGTTFEKVPVLIPIPSAPAAATPPPAGCCSVMFPCVSPSCTGIRNVCGELCSHRYLYAPVDPCAEGCYRRDYAFGTYCNSYNQCRFGLMDCSSCERGFYMEYRSYRQCSGCFYV